MVVVEPQLQVVIDLVQRTGRIERIVDVVFFEIVEAPAVFAPGGVENQRKRGGIGNPAWVDLVCTLAVLDHKSVVEPEASADCDFPVVGAAMSVDRFIAHPGRYVGERLGDVCGRAR